MWWSKSKPALEEFTLDAIIRMLMQIDAKLDRLLYHLGEDDAEENDT